MLPQLVAVSADALLPGIGTQPGGPSAILVLTLQGDRLEPDTADNPANYTVAFLGPDGLPGTADDEVLPVRDVVYNPDANVDVSSGQTIPEAVRQTVTLLFDRALPPGSYAIEISPDVQATPFNSAEVQLVAQQDSFGFHPLVSHAGGPITAGVEVVEAGLVRMPGELGDLTVFENGTSFLTQFHNDLGALADAILKRLGDEPVTAEILEHILARIAPSLGELGQRPTSLLVLFLDPVSFGLVDPNGQRTTFDLQTNQLASYVPKTFVEVGGNVEVIVVADAAGDYRLDLADIPERARGAAVLLGNHWQEAISLTPAIRDGERSFVFSLAAALRTPRPIGLSVPSVDAVFAAATAQASGSPQAVNPAQAPASAAGGSLARLGLGILNSPRLGDYLSSGGASGAAPGVPNRETLPWVWTELAGMIREVLHVLLKVLGLDAVWTP